MYIGNLEIFLTMVLNAFGTATWKELVLWATLRLSSFLLRFF